VKLVQAGSIAGLEFDVAVAASISGLSEGESNLAIKELEEAGLVAPPRNGSDQGLRSFEHALIQKAIDGSMMRRQRNKLHGLLADRLLAEGGEATREDVNLAYHLARAGRPREAAEVYLAGAAASAQRGNAAEALSKLDKGLKAVDNLPEGRERDSLELRLRAIQGPTRMVTRGPGSPGFGETQSRALELLRRLRLSDQIIPVLYNSALHEWASARLDRADAYTDEISAYARDHASDGGYLAEHTMRGLVAWHRGDNALARTSLTATVERYDPDRHRDLYMVFLKEFGVFGLFYLGLAETVAGDLEAGRGRARQALELGRRVGRPHPVAFGLLAGFVTAMLRGDVEQAERFSAESLAYSGRQGFPEFVAMSRVCQGWVECRRGKRPGGIDLMSEGTEQWGATGFSTWGTLFTAMIAEEMAQAGRLESASALIYRAKERIAESGEHQFDSPVAIAEIRLASAIGDNNGAETIRARAMQVAEAQGGRLWLDKLGRAMP
jgi:tetratricopeptide (TPR) repeat protein